MKIIVSDIASEMAQLGIPPEAQERYLVAALSRVLGYLLPIPANDIAGSLDEYFAVNHGKDVANALTALNERMPVDFDQVQSLTQKIWEVRYGLVHARRDAQAWGLLDACVQKANLGYDIDFTDASLQRLAAVMTQGLES